MILNPEMYSRLRATVLLVLAESSSHGVLTLSEIQSAVFQAGFEGVEADVRLILTEFIENQTVFKTGMKYYSMNASALIGIIARGLAPV
jgi:hypothetical protein